VRIAFAVARSSADHRRSCLTPTDPEGGAVGASPPPRDQKRGKRKREKGKGERGEEKRREKKEKGKKN